MARFTVGNPWLTMWVKPRQTIREIISYNPSFRLGILSVVYGLPLMLSFAQQGSMAQNVSMTFIVIFCLLLSFVIGFIGINIGSALLYLVGKWIGGLGSFKQVRGAVAWSNVTNVVNCAIWFALIVVFKNEVFLADFPQSPFQGAHLYLMNIVYLVQFVVAIWGLIIFLHALGEVQGFSAWKALLNVILPILLIFVAIWAISFVMNLLSVNSAA